MPDHIIAGKIMLVILFNTNCFQSYLSILLLKRKPEIYMNIGKSNVLNIGCNALPLGHNAFIQCPKTTLQISKLLKKSNFPSLILSFVSLSNHTFFPLHDHLPLNQVNPNAFELLVCVLRRQKT